MRDILSLPQIHSCKKSKSHIAIMDNNFICILALLSVCLQAQTSCSLVNAFTSPQLFSQKPTLTSKQYLKQLAATNDNDGGASASERKPWELLRFISQSSKFVKPPSLPFVKGRKRQVLPGMLA